MNLSAQKIANMLGGTVEGDKSVYVSKLAKIENGDTRSLSFLGNPKYNKFIYQSKYSILICLHIPVNIITELKSRESYILIKIVYGEIDREPNDEIDREPTVSFLLFPCQFPLVPCQSNLVPCQFVLVPCQFNLVPCQSHLVPCQLRN